MKYRSGNPLAVFALNPEQKDFVARVQVDPFLPVFTADDSGYNNGTQLLGEICIMLKFKKKFWYL